MFDEREIACGFDEFYCLVDEYRKDTFTFVFGSDKFDAEYFVMSEDDNNLELDDPNYDEFFSIWFEKPDGSFCEVNIHNMPDEVYHKGILVLKKVNGKLQKYTDEIK